MFVYVRQNSVAELVLWLLLLLWCENSFLCEIQYVHLVYSLVGPAVGDILSRCLRLADESTSEALAVRRLLGHRLPINPQQAKSEWYCLILPPLVSCAIMLLFIKLN